MSRKTNFFIGLFILTFSSLFAQWTQLKPTPVSDNINCIRFIDVDHGLAVCGYGIILKTDDGGNTWHRANTGTTEYLTKLTYLNPTTAIACGFNSTILRSTDGGDNWSFISVPSATDFRTMDFDGNIGYATGDAYNGSFSMVKTTDGGLTWNIVSAVTDQSFFSVNCIAPDTVFAGASNGYLYKTFNGGMNWDSTMVSSSSINAIEFITADTGYFAAGSILKRTYNGGANWLTQNASVGVIQDIQFLDTDTGFITGDYGNVARTTNGGGFWSTLTSILDPFYAYTICPFNSSRLFVGGMNGMFRKSLNSGTNWTDIQNGYPFPIFSSFFVNDSTAYTCGNRGTILKTTNRFQTYTRQHNLANVDLYGIYFTSADTGFSVGTNGHIYKTVNGGTNWFDAIPNVPLSQLNSVFFIGSDTGYVTGNNEILMKTTDRGVSWDTVHSPSGATTTNYRKIYFIDHNIGFILCNYMSMLRTADGGATWSTPSYIPYPPPTQSRSLLGISFPSHNIGYAAGTDSMFLKTTDAGLTWIKMLTPQGLNVNAVYFMNDSTGYMLASNRIFVTTDGGNTFSEEFCPTGSGINDINFSPDGVGYIFGYGGSILTNDTTLSTGIFETTTNGQSKKIEIFPNPATNALSIRFSKVKYDSELMIKIYDITGRSIVAMKKPADDLINIDVSSLPSGLYVVCVWSDTEMSAAHFIKN